MKVIKKYNQTRRDCYADMVCEGCGDKKTDTTAYDDRNYWDNVVPTYKCEKCGKSSNDLGLNHEPIITRYSPFEIV